MKRGRPEDGKHDVTVHQMDSKVLPIVFTPDNEPYLGRTLLFHFDQLIISAMKQNSVTAPKSDDGILTDHQDMACQVVAQALSITLSIRELIRQGYLFGAQVLLRPLVERVTILLYLDHYPNDIKIWKEGWHQNDAPGLAKMFNKIQVSQQRHPMTSGAELTAEMNSLLHGKPDSASWNLIPLGATGLGHAVSKILNRPDLCDGICADTIPWLATLLGMVATYFPAEPVA
jgi:hypothetical protein